MNRNGIYIVAITLAVVTLVLSYQLHQERHKPGGFEVNIGGKSISVETR